MFERTLETKPIENPHRLSTATMRGSSLLPKRFRTSNDGSSSPPSWLSRQITDFLLNVSQRACLHPIHTIVFIAILASTSYVGLLEGSLFDSSNTAKHARGHVDTASLLAGARTLQLGKGTAWRWREGETALVEDGQRVWLSKLGYKECGILTDSIQPVQHLALSTFIFPDSHTSTSQLAPRHDAISFPENLTVTELPTTSNMLSPISQDSTLAFSVPYEHISEFLRAAQEIPDRSGASNGHEEKMWIMKAARNNGHGLRSLRAWWSDSRTSFVDLIKVCLENSKVASR